MSYVAVPQSSSTTYMWPGNYRFYLSGVDMQGEYTYVYFTAVGYGSNFRVYKGYSTGVALQDGASGTDNYANYYYYYKTQSSTTWKLTTDIDQSVGQNGSVRIKILTSDATKLKNTGICSNYSGIDWPPETFIKIDITPYMKGIPFKLYNSSGQELSGGGGRSMIAQELSVKSYRLPTTMQAELLTSSRAVS